MDGIPVVRATGRAGSVLDVAATGTPHPLPIVSVGTDGGTLRLSGCGQRRSVPVPPDALDLSSVQGG